MTQTTACRQCGTWGDDTMPTYRSDMCGYCSDAGNLAMVWADAPGADQGATTEKLFPNSQMITAREAIPGTRIAVITANEHGVGWKLATVREWRGLGNGYAELISDDGFHCGQYEADHLFELVPPGN